MKHIFVIDWTLIPLFVLTAYTGIELHVHGSNHELWYNWAIFHILASFLFFTTAIFHVTTHWGWYKGFIKNGIGKKSKVTLCLSAIFAFIAITGIILLNIDDVNSPIGLWHYKIGILMSIISIGHILKRIPILRKSLKAKTHNTHE